MISALSSVNVYPLLLLILGLLQAVTSHARSSNPQCIASSCGDIRDIHSPFRLKTDPKGCGESKHELTCENNRTVLYLLDGRFYVQSINYSAHIIRLIDDGLQKNNCLSFPRHLLAIHSINSDPNIPYIGYSNDIFVIVNCSKPVSSPSYISTRPCIEGSYSSEGSYPSEASSNWNLYALVNPNALDVKDFCTISSWTWVSRKQIYSSSDNYELIHNSMAEGFDLEVYVGESQPKKTVFCYLDFYIYFHFHNYFFGKHYWSGGQVCGSKLYSGGVQDDIAIWTAGDFIILLVLFCVAKFVIGTPFVAIFLIYKYRRRHLAMDKNIEEFLQAHNNFLPIRYSYSNIKKITRNFKHKLGEGGYGSVYKGMLRSGNEVAIKILKSKAHGQDFISEVATIGRIHHVNVVQLIGFCFEGSKQALVYDLMSNGSLDKHIFAEEGDKFLDYKKIYEIALGVARGIEYLHRGCDMQILHFDIKPHNILLDNNFTPKVSDFGLAKLYPTDHSIVSLTAARGTLGYMAPELFYKNIGGISYKADVYSFGMLLMEMAGRRKNVNADAEHSSQIYFPLWIYDQVSEGASVETEEAVEEEREVIKKMIVVALWCIQLIPDHRPPMNKVLEMLEGDIGNIQMPPKPLIYPPDEPVEDDKVSTELETFSTSSSAPIISASFPFGDSNDV
ncbi:rust resistance kinase Lr10-like isoform X1 [Syzygium oleosum]|uniref:rust resistance kinase Lr10-like isoform X1 n=1 Tax=Syzygium oleosum TaxID=219896 RepID=UPI0024B93D8E|nr:rust resistance kinase Lr10-like isoform X1 [Syzygium oleosum]